MQIIFVGKLNLYFLQNLRKDLNFTKFLFKNMKIIFNILNCNNLKDNPII